MILSKKNLRAQTRKKTSDKQRLVHFFRIEAYR